jgi:purine-nucleoside phosphorylase
MPIARIRLAIEMEAAALYTFARTTGARVLCLAHVTNTMGLIEQDFEMVKVRAPPTLSLRLQR